MAIHLERDDRARRIVAVGQGRLDAAEMIRVLQGLRDEGAWSYAVLLDLRAMHGAPSIAELRPIMEIASQSAGDERSRGPLAVVADKPELYGMACAYAALSQPGRVEVFRERDEADAWLAHRTGEHPG